MMSRRIKAAVYILFTAVFALFFASGCHGAKKTPEFEVPESFIDTKKYDIVFWAKNDTNKNQTDIYEKAISDFEELYPNIDVTVRFYTDYGKIYNDVITNIATDTTPNVCITYPDHIATYITGDNVVVDLEPLFEDEKYGWGGTELKYDGPTRSELIDKFMDECIISDSHYAIPFMRSTEACYINADYVRALGYEIPEVLTWDYIWEVSEAALKKNADGTYALNNDNVMLPFIYKSTDNMLISYLFQKNAPYSEVNGNIGIFNDTTSEFLRVVRDHAATGAFSTFKISGYPGNFLCAGQCVFAVDSTAGATWMGSKAPHSDISEEKVAVFETAVRPVPQADPGNMKMISQGPSICIFNKKDPGEVLASWFFAQYLLTDEVQIGYAKTEGYVPVTNKARETEEYKYYLDNSDEDSEEYYSVKIDATRVLLENTDNTFVTPVFNGSASLRDAAGELVENVTKSVRRNQTVDDQYLEKLYAEMNSLYRLDEKTKEAYISVNTPLPAQSVALLAVLAVVWVILLGMSVTGYIRRLREKSIS